MGKYRGRKKLNGKWKTRSLPAGIKWAKEGDWVTSLGSPIGNDLDHEAWWNKKIDSIEAKAIMWTGIFRTSYFGRDLIVQAKFLGSLRYWLFSIPQSKKIKARIQASADILWWSKNPTLDGTHSRFRRFIQRETAIGPHNQGGLNNMEWSSHVDGFLESWIIRMIRPPYLDKCAWKQILYHMLLVDKRGYDKFPEGFNILLTPMPLSLKIKLLRGFPRRATYIRECLRAHWQLNIKLDMEDYTGLQAEPIWHSPRPTDTFMDFIYNKLLDCLKQIPQEITDQLKIQYNEPTPDLETDDMVCLIEDGNFDGEHLQHGTILKNGRIEEHWIDALGIPHATGQIIDPTGLLVLPVTVWPVKNTIRVIGPTRTTYPRIHGWKIDGKNVKLSDLNIKNTRRHLILRKFKRPPSETSWEVKTGALLALSHSWKLKSFFTTPRDRTTWLKFRHRNLFTTGHMQDSSGCTACGAHDNQLHIITCPIIREEFWDPIIALLKNLGMPEPETITYFLITGQLEDSQKPDKEGNLKWHLISEHLVGILEIAFRCLYAAITKTRLEGGLLNLEAAYARAMHMTKSRISAYGEKWKQWVVDNDKTHKKSVIPRDHTDKTVMVQDSHTGSWEIHKEILKETTRTKTALHPDLDPENVSTPPPPPLNTPTTVQPTPPTPQQPPQTPDPDRDMSGDALTTAQAASLGLHAQCTLAATRNIRRNPTYTKSRLAERCIAPEYPGDIRLPDWPQILAELADPETECVQGGRWNMVPQHLLSDIQSAISITHSPHTSYTHVIALIWDEGGFFKVYNNDSREAQKGTYKSYTTQDIAQMMGPDKFYAVTPKGGELHSRLGPELVTLIHRPTRRLSDILTGQNL